MVVQKKVTTIPASLTRFTATPITELKKRRVAGYARVSTDHDDQFTSYAAQIDYYTNYIKSRDDWKFVDIKTAGFLQNRHPNRHPDTLVPMPHIFVSNSES